MANKRPSAARRPPWGGFLRATLRAGACALGLLWGQAVWAQFSMVPAPVCPPPRESAQDVEQEFRIDAARHLYTCFPMRVYKGRLPPLLYSVMMVEIDVDTTGAVTEVAVVRKPAAAEVAPWVLALIRRASPFPAPVKMAGGRVKFTETYFIDKSGLFQVMSITEGQR